LESSEIVFAESNHIGASETFGHSGKNKQQNDVSELMTMVSSAGPSEIRYGECKILQSRQNARLDYGSLRISLYICSRIDLRYGVNTRFLVKYKIVHNVLFFNPLSYE
jgi:hypothetical protein